MPKAEWDQLKKNKRLGSVHVDLGYQRGKHVRFDASDEEEEDHKADKNCGKVAKEEGKSASDSKAIVVEGGKGNSRSGFGGNMLPLSFYAYRLVKLQVMDANLTVLVNT